MPLHEPAHATEPICRGQTNTLAAWLMPTDLLLGSQRSRPDEEQAENFNRADALSVREKETI